MGTRLLVGTPLDAPLVRPPFLPTDDADAQLLTRDRKVHQSDLSDTAEGRGPDILAD